MESESYDTELATRAAQGDAAALERLLVLHYDRLLAEFTPKLPAEFRSVLTAEDVLQETFVVAFREITGFAPLGPGSFHAWLSAIAQHRLFDLVKNLRAVKRGGGRAGVEARAAAGDTSLISLLEALRVDLHTPSRSAAGHEAVRAVHVGLAGLREDYREALRLRYIEGLSVAQTAARLGRTERAVHMLCHRALLELRKFLGRSSQFFSHG